MELLSAEQPPHRSGSLLHGALFARLKAVDQEAADLAHAAEPRPFSLSELYRDGERHSFRCCGLVEGLSRALPEAFREGVELSIGEVRARVVEVAVEDESYEGLYERFVPREGSRDRVALRFLTPTTFRVGRVNMPFPLPRLLWRSWAGRWNAFSQVGLGDFEAWAEEFIAPSRFRVRSLPARVGGSTLVGSVGKCEYVILRPDSIEARVAAMLAEYATYCGSGQKTTMGMGATERIPPWRERST